MLEAVDAPAAPNALDTELSQQPLDRATSHADTLTIELRPTLTAAPPTRL